MTWQGWDKLTPVLRIANFWDSQQHSATPGSRRTSGGFGPRYIEEFQILFVQSGHGRAWVGDASFEIEPGDLVYYGPNVRHEVRAIGTEPLKLVGMAFVFVQEDLACLPEPKGHTSERPFVFERGAPRCPLTPPPPAHVHATPASSVRRLCESLVLSHVSDRDGRHLEKRGLLLMLFEAWHEAILQRGRSESLPLPHRRAVEAAQTRIREHPEDEVDLASLAASAGLSAAYFARLFKQQTGLSVKAYAAQHRMLRARRLLAEGRLSVKEVAHELGFDDPFYFSRLFTRHFGVSPSAFRSSRQMI